MKRLVVCLLIVCLFSLNSVAEKAVEEWKVPDRITYYETDGKTGLKSADGEILAEAKYDYIGCFDEHGLAHVYSGDQIGIIRADGKVIVPLMNCSGIGFSEYSYGGITELRDEALLFYNRKGNEVRTGFYSLDGKIITEAIWENTYGFKNGLAPVKKDGQWNILNLQGKTLFPSWWDKISIGQDNILLETDTRMIQIDNNGDIFAEYQKDSDGNWLLFSYNGQALLSPIICEFVIRAEKGFFFYDGTKCGLMGTNEEILCSPKWDQLTCFQENLFQIWEGEKTGIINARGETVLEPLYENIQLVTRDVWLARDEKSFSLFNSSGTCIKEWSKTDYKTLFAEKDGYLRYAIADGQWGYMDADGTILSGFDTALVCPQPFGEYNEEWLEIEYVNTEQKGFMNVDGTILSSADWTLTKPFSNGFAAVRLTNEKWIFIDSQGNPICDDKWDNCDEFLPSMFGLVAWVSKGNDDGTIISGYIDTQGNPVNIWYVSQAYQEDESAWKK